MSRCAGCGRRHPYNVACGVTRTTASPKLYTPDSHAAACLGELESETCSCWRHSPTNHGHASSGCPHQLPHLRMVRRLPKGKVALTHTMQPPRVQSDTPYEDSHAPGCRRAVPLCRVMHRLQSLTPTYLDILASAFPRCTAPGPKPLQHRPAQASETSYVALYLVTSLSKGGTSC